MTRDRLRREDKGYVDPRVERTRELLARTAADQVLAGGFGSVTFETVAARARVARSTVYRHFGSPAELLAAALDHLLPPVDRAPPGGDVEQRLSAVLTQFAGYLATAPVAAALPAWLALTQEGDGALRARVVDRHREPLRDALRTGVADGSLDPALDLDLAVAELFGPLLFRVLVTGEPVDAATARAVAHAFCSAHRAAGGGPTGGGRRD